MKIKNSFMNQLQELLNDTEDRANNIEDALRREREDKANVRRSLDTLTEEQSAYLGIPKEGPYKADMYRY